MTTTLPTAIPGVVIHKEVWTQCENENCSKWRKLPPGSVVDEDAPWYCYMNPDPRRARCSASEESYDEKTEIVLPADGHLDDEEALHNQLIKRHLEASIAAAAALGQQSAAARGRGRGRGGGGGSGRGKGGRGRGRGRGKGAPKAAEWDYYPQASQQSKKQQQRVVSYKEDSDLSLSDDAGSPVPAAAAPTSRAVPARARRQHAAHFLRLLDNRGSWEWPPAPGALPPFAPPPAAVWEALSQQAPELAEVACEAANAASSERYFQGGQGGAEEAGLLARLALMLSSAGALEGVQDTLTLEEKQRAGLAPAAAAGGGAPAALAGMPGGPAALLPPAGGGLPANGSAFAGMGPSAVGGPASLGQPAFLRQEHSQPAMQQALAAAPLANGRGPAGPPAPAFGGMQLPSGTLGGSGQGAMLPGVLPGMPLWPAAPAPSQQQQQQQQQQPQSTAGLSPQQIQAMQQAMLKQQAAQQAQQAAGQAAGQVPPTGMQPPHGSFPMGPLPGHPGAAWPGTSPTMPRATQSQPQLGMQPPLRGVPGGLPQWQGHPQQQFGAFLGGGMPPAGLPPGGLPAPQAPGAVPPPRQ